MPFFFSRSAVRAVDHAAIHEYHIPGIVLMENAALALADHAIQMLSGSSSPSVLIICGPGNNGGDGYACARHLHNHYVAVTLMPLDDPRPSTDAHTNFLICKSMNIPFVSPEDRDSLPHYSLIIDAIFGTGLDRPITGLPESIINWVNAKIAAQRIPVLAADIPSGLDCDTGLPIANTDGTPNSTIRATATVTFVGRKLGFRNPASSEFTGTVHVAPIGCPVELLSRFGIQR
ncbi:MAG TPA: NAD(P)H-hydrate epimerase [Phycisphaerales bacterium]|nr:NAD(P)H-hydrate epimerase [Phycisphaerales bacterium]